MFELEAYFAERRVAIDAAMDARLPAASETPVALHRAMRYSVFSGGKRLRPILCLAAAQAVDPSPNALDRAMLPAIAVEFFHTFTLIHDDLPSMDNDSMRRGRPTCHVVFGEATAVLAGDALQALAFEIAAGARLAPGLPPTQLIVELAEAAGSRGVVGGQVEDLAADARTSAEQIAFIHRHKTADLFRAAVRMGALTADADAASLAALSDYGMALGMAFQITDDVLDAADVAPGSPRKPGASCLTVITQEEARRQAGALIEEAIGRLADMPAARVQPLREIARFVLTRTA
jgi:geranylgeranyl diphosphate synthase type II